VRLKKLYIAALASALFWGPSIGSSGMTDAVPTGTQAHRTVFGWHSTDNAETLQLSNLNSEVFILAASDSKSLFAEQPAN
jgi:hypothetical protein